MIQCYRVRDDNEARDIALEAEAHEHGKDGCKRTACWLLVVGLALVGLPLWAVLA